MAGILLWPKALPNEECVSTGPVSAVDGPLTSGFKIVALSSCTSCQKRLVAACDTVATTAKVGFDSC